MKISLLSTSKYAAVFKLLPQHFLLLTFLWLSLTFPSRAQNKIWDKTFGGSLNDGLSAMVATPDGGYLLGGSSLSNKGGDKTENGRNKPNLSDDKGDYWVVKINASGQKVWDKTFGGDNSDELTTLLPTPDGGYLLGGTSFSGQSGDKSESNRATFDANGQITPDYWLVKINATGQKEWDKTFGGTSEDRLTTMIATTDGGFLLGGSSNSGRSGDKSGPRKGDNGFTDYWLIKIKADGTKQWDKTYGCSFLDWLTAVQQTSDGGYIVGGTSESGKCLDKTEASKGYGDYWLVKLDATGNKQWDKTIGGEGGEELAAILVTSEGGYLLGGSSGSGISGDKSTLFPGYWLVMLNAAGEKVWDRSYGGSVNDKFQAMVPAPDGGYLLAGTSTRGKGRDKNEDKMGYWVVKIKENGAKVWERTFGGAGLYFTWPYYATLRSLVATPDNGFLLGGTSNAEISGDKSEISRGAGDYWVVKIANSNKKVQEITLATPLITKNLGDAPLTLSAQASSGLPVTFSIVAGPGTLTQNTLTLTGVGKITVKASQAGNSTYAAATEVRQTIIVDQRLPVTKLWDKTFGGNNYDALTAMVPTPEGGYLLAGNSSSGQSGDKSTPNGGFWLVKINQDGTKVWDITLSGYGDLGDVLSRVLVTPDGGYLLGGTALYDFNALYRVIKISSTGTKEWEKTFGAFNESGNYLAALLATPDGGYLLGGTSNSGISQVKSEASRGGNDYWVVKIDGNGDKLWDKTLGGNEADELSALVAAPDGGYLLGGSSGSDKSGEKSENNKGATNPYGSPSVDFWVVKIDASGKKLWDKTLGGKQEDMLRALIASSDGGYLLGGSSNSDKSGDKKEENKGQPDAQGIFPADFWVVKLNEQGQKQWDKTIGGNGEDGLAAITLTPDNNFLLGGSSASERGQDKSGERRGANDYWLVKLAASGQLVWDKTLGGASRNELTAVLLTPDNSYLVGGHSTSGANGDKSEPSRDTGPYQRGDYWVVKLKEELPVTTQWNLRYGGSGTDNLTSVIKTSDGGYLAGGYSNSGNSGDKSQTSQGLNDYWLVKSDKNGTKLWDKRYGGSAEDYLNRVIQTQDGGYLLAGSSLSGKSGDKSEASKGGRDYWVVKVDATGNKEWDKAFGGSGDDELKKVVQLASGEYVLGGFSNSPSGGDKTQASQGSQDYWLVKISRTGTKLWDKRYGGSLDEELGSFTQTTDGGFLLGGTTLSGKSGDKTQSTQGGRDYWVVKTDKDGNLVWEKTFGGNGQDEVYSVGRSHGENLFIAGTSNSGKNGDKSQASQGGKDYWLLKLDKNGNKLWDRSLGGSQDDELRASTFTDQGHYVLAGSSFSDISGDKTKASQGGSDYWVVEVDEKGDQVQNQRFGGSGAEELRTVFQTNEGGLLLGGRSDSGVSGDKTQPSQGAYDYWLVKVAPDSSSRSVSRIAKLEEELAVPTERNELKVYPNPFRERLLVRFTLPATQSTTVKVYNSLGREIATLFQGEAKAEETYQVEWQAARQANGVYLLQLQTPTQSSQQKILLAK